MLREYLISEFMAAAGVPTTRSLAVVATGEEIWRETKLPGAVLARVAASHLRVGTFQFFAARGDQATLRRLADYAIARHYPDLAPALGTVPVQAVCATSFSQVVQAVDSHTAGEPTRIVTGGVPPVRGATMADKRAALQRGGIVTPRPSRT
jgi:uncharacterized protein YdiU (UPF0061 family)